MILYWSWKERLFRSTGVCTATVTRSSARLLVTGDSIPSIPETGALVPAGAKVEAGSLCLRVERTHAESVLPALRPSTLFQRPLEEGLTGLKAALVGYGPPVVVYVATLVMVVSLIWRGRRPVDPPWTGYHAHCTGE